MKIPRLLYSLLIVVFLSGCASVSLVDSRRMPNAPAKTYRSFLVVGITENRQTRQIFEGVMSAELKKKGLSAIPSYTVTNIEEQLSVSMVEKAALATAVDGVITARVVDMKKKSHTDVGYVMSDRGNYGMVSYATFDMKPVEITTSTTFCLESNLFDTATKGLVWTGTSNAVDPKGIITGSEKFAAIVINAMTKEGLIP